MLKIKDVRVEVNESKLFGRMDKAKKKSMVSLASQILKDCNRYAKKDTGTMITSSFTASKLEQGKLIWNTPYARRQYYLASTRKSINSQAKSMWAEYAKSIHKKTWAKIAKKIMIDEGGF